MRERERNAVYMFMCVYGYVRVKCMGMCVYVCVCV